MRQEDHYKAIQVHTHYPIEKLCQYLKVNRSAYYRWLKRTPGDRQLENEHIVEWIKALYEEPEYSDTGR